MKHFRSLFTTLIACALAWHAAPVAFAQEPSDLLPEASAQQATLAAPRRLDVDQLRAELGPVTMRVSPGRIERLSDGKVWTTNWYNQPLNNALAYALRLSGPGEVIGLSGEHPFVRIGGINESKVFEAARPKDPATGKRPPIPHCAIVRDDGAERPTIYGLGIAGTADETDGGIEGLTFVDVELTCDPIHFQKTALLVEQFIQTGYLRFWRCDWSRSTDPSAWQGWGKMWGMRTHGVILYFEAIDCVAGDALEHSLVYGDNWGRHGHTSRIVRCRVIGGRGGGRTCFQLANRPDSGPSGDGKVVIEDCDFRCIGGNGGGAITFASSSAHIVIRRTRITLAGPHNGVMIWVDSGHGGLYANDAGFAHDSVLIDGLQVTGGNRPHIAISAAERVTIANGFRVRGTAADGLRHCFDFGADGWPRIQNGEIQFVNVADPLSQYTGFQSGVQARIAQQVLSAAQLDALAVSTSP